MFDEFETILNKHNIRDHACKPVTKSYAFDDVPNVPSESTYLKVVYPFAEAQIPYNLTGHTFSHVFGTGSSALELVILKRKLMGPCWIEIKGGSLSLKNVYKIIIFNIDIFMFL